MDEMRKDYLCQTWMRSEDVCEKWIRRDDRDE
jgi:hypothetical protein